MMDFHCHLDLYPNAREIIEQSEKRGIFILAVTTTPRAWLGSKRLVGNAKRIRLGLGLHPEIAKDRLDELSLFDLLLPEARYVGEVGLDGSKDHRPFLEKQRLAFRHILTSCERSGGKPLSIHSRGAAKLVLEDLRELANSCVPIFHWFSGSPTELEDAVKQGGWFSVGPAMMASEKGRRLISAMPRDKVFLESDGPLAKRGGRGLTPFDATESIKVLAEIWSEGVGVASERMNLAFRNFVRELPGQALAQ